MTIPFAIQQIEPTSAKWLLVSDFNRFKLSSAAMSNDGNFYVFYEHEFVEKFTLVDIDGNLIKEVYTELKDEDFIIGFDLSFKGDYLILAYINEAQATSLRVIEIKSSEIILEVKSAFIFLTSATKNLLLYEVIDDFTGEALHSVIYDLDLREEKARFSGRHAGRFSDISLDGSRALLVSNNEVLSYIDLQGSFEPVQLLDLGGLHYDGAVRTNPRFYTRDIFGLEIREDIGQFIRFFQLKNGRIELLREFINISQQPIIDEHLFGLPDLNYQNMLMLDPLTGGTLFEQDAYWEYLAISPNGRWVTSYNRFLNSLNIYHYPEMTLVEEIPNCVCQGGEFSADSTRFMTVSGFGEEASVLVFELQEAD
jgi:hypothetical protein